MPHSVAYATTLVNWWNLRVIRITKRPKQNRQLEIQWMYYPFSHCKYLKDLSAAERQFSHISWWRGEYYERYSGITRMRKISNALRKWNTLDRNYGNCTTQWLTGRVSATNHLMLSYHELHLIIIMIPSSEFLFILSNHFNPFQSIPD